MSKPLMGTEFCKSWQKEHENCIGCPSEELCAQKARYAIESVEKIRDLLSPYMEEVIK